MERWPLQSAHLLGRSHFNMTLNISATGVHEVPWTAQNQTRKLIASLQLAQVQTLRTTHLTLGAFSLALTLLMVHRIVSDARKAAATQVSLRKQRFSALRNVHPAETFPLVLACGAVIQQTIFVAVQGTSLHSVLSDNCQTLAALVFPAIFVLGIMTMVFGFEMTIRAFRSERFASRGKWNTTICLGIIGFLMLLTWLPTVIFPMYKRCFGSLIWFPLRYELIAISILSILVFFFLLLAGLLSIQLMRTANIDPTERIAASRMCYYLLLNALLYILVFPVEIQIHQRNFLNSLATSRIAEVALFTSGMVIAFLHLFLRVNATRMVINPVSSSPASRKQKRPKIRFFGPSDLEMNISGPLALQRGPRPDSRQGLIDIGPEKNHYDFDPDYFTRPHRPLSPGSMKSQGPIDPTRWPLPPDPLSSSIFQDTKEAASGLHKRTKSSYSLFPTRAEDVPRLPATVYSPPANRGNNNDTSLATRRQTRRSSIGDAKSVTDVSEAYSFLTKPPPLFAGRHGRNESSDSSATVQIGLRFSLAPATLAAAKYTVGSRSAEHSAPPLLRGTTESSEDTLNLPIQAPSTISASGTPEEEPSTVAFPQPPQRAVSPAKLSPGKTPAFPVLSTANSGEYLQAQREKVLPPTPRTAVPGPPPRNNPPPPMPLNGLRMNPMSPASPARSALSRSPTSSVPSPTARIGLAAGTMARSPPPNGWI